ncbi:MAG: SagB/ThcOx family dehydrogenase, partial [Actinobacteria bacterium]|nr:SagB/ThcOx family dehydrogenase [Actinomycetota bacterium]
MPEGIGDKYQKQTKYRRGRLPNKTLDWSKRPEVYKEYADTPIIKLPNPQPVPGGMALDEAFMRRKSTRDFAAKPINSNQISYLLWASAGIQRVERGHEFRMVPSAGALYPIETYVVINNSFDVPSGLYHYSVKKHLLEELKRGDLGVELASAALDQDVCVTAAAVFIWSGVFFRSKWKYGERAYRYTYLDAGHVAENLYLAAVSKGLGAC